MITTGWPDFSSTLVRMKEWGGPNRAAESGAVANEGRLTSAFLRQTAGI
jgi:hypothetical protein